MQDVVFIPILLDWGKKTERRAIGGDGTVVWGREAEEIESRL